MSLPGDVPATEPAVLDRRRRWLHPIAWWLWAGALAVGAMATTNALILGLVVAVAAYVVSARRPEAPWARSFSVFLKVGVFVIAVRVLLQVLFGARTPGTVLFELPAVQVPDWLAGVTIGGPVTLEAIVAAARDGARLATVLICFGAVNSLASPYRLLRSLPPVLYEVGVAITVALSFTPELVTALGQRREARRLRGRAVRGLDGVRGLALPVMEGALDRAVSLAASMDTRGYGHRRDADRRSTRIAAVATAVGLAALVVGTYGLLDASAPRGLGLPLLAVGSAVIAASLVIGSRRATRTRYRPDPWRWPEWAVVASGVAFAASVRVTGALDPEALQPSSNPLTWEGLPPLVLLGALVATTAGVAAPLPPDVAAARGRGAVRRVHGGAPSGAPGPVPVDAGSLP